LMGRQSNGLTQKPKSIITKFIDFLKTKNKVGKKH